MGLTFDEKKHVYKYDGKKLESANKLISNFHEPFDEKKIANIVAKKRGTTVKQVMIEWWKSRKKGDQIHDLCESLIINKEVNDCPEEFKGHIYSASLFLKDRLKSKDMDNVYAEKQLYNLDYGIAGTADVVFIDKKNKVIKIYDWKTNNKLETTSYNNKTMYEPLTHLVDSKYTRYCLQLSLYAYMLEQMYPDFKIQELAFVHLTDKGYKVFNTPYLKTDILNMLNEYKRMKEMSEV